MDQLLKVEGQGVTGHVELVGEDARRQSFGAGGHQGAECAQALYMGHGTEGETAWVSFIFDNSALIE